MLLRKFIGKFISYAIMPSQLYQKKDPTSPAEDHYILLQDGSKINFSIYGNHENAETLIIHAVGNSDIYEHHIPEYKVEAKKFPRTNIVAFNFRNVGKSTGEVSAQEDWINDTIAVINHFRDKGFKSENILLSGHSLGAAILTLAAAKDYESNGKQDCVRVLNDRTFSDLPTEITELILGKTGSIFFICLCLAIPFGIFSALSVAAGLALLESLPYFFPTLPSFSISKEAMKGMLKPLLWVTFGTMDVAKAYRSLPSGVKDYVMAKNDKIIPPKANLHAALGDLRKQEKKAAQNNLDDLLNIKDRKLATNPWIVNSNQKMDEHNASLVFLSPYHKKRSNIPTTDGNPLPPPPNGRMILDTKIGKLLRLS